MPRRPRREPEVWLYSFFNLGAGWGWVVNATPRPLYPRERPGTHCTGGRVGPKAGLYRCGKSRLQPGFDPRTVQSIESRYTIPAHTPPLYDVRHLPVRRRLRSPLSSHHHLHCGWTDVLPSCTCTHTLVCCLTFAILHNVEIHFYQWNSYWHTPTLTTLWRMWLTASYWHDS